MNELAPITMKKERTYPITQLLRGSVRMHIANAIDGPITNGIEGIVLFDLDVFA